MTILPRRVAAAELSIGALRAIRITDASFTRTVGVRMLAGARRSPLADELLAEIGRRDDSIEDL